MLLQLLLQLVEECEGIGDSPGEAAEDGVVVQASQLRSPMLHDHVPHGHLTVTGEGHLPASLDGDDGRRPHALHRYDALRTGRRERPLSAATRGGRYLQL